MNTGRKAKTGFLGWKYGPVGGCHDHSNQLFDSMTERYFLATWQSVYQKCSCSVTGIRTLYEYRSGLFYGARSHLKPLKAELNPICHLLVLLGDLTFMCPGILCIFQYTSISNKMQRYTVYLYLETALHVSGGTSTHHQERIQLYLQHLVFVTPLLLSAAIVEMLEPV
jgi:hypothetical protein